MGRPWVIENLPNFVNNSLTYINWQLPSFDYECPKARTVINKFYIDSRGVKSNLSKRRIALKWFQKQRYQNLTID